MHRLTVLVKAGAQCLVATAQNFDGAAEPGQVEIALKAKCKRLVEGAGGLLAELSGEPDLALRFGEGRGLEDLLVFSEAAGRWRQSAALLHLGDSLREGALNARQVGVGVLGGEEAGEVLEQVNAFFAQAVVEQAAEAGIAVEGEVEDAGKVFDVCGHA